MKKGMKTAALAAILVGSAAWCGCLPAAASAVDDALARTLGTFTPAAPVEPQKPKAEQREEQKQVQETQPKKTHEQKRESVREDRREQKPASNAAASRDAAKPMQMLPKPDAGKMAQELPKGQGEVAGQSPDFAAIQSGIASYQKRDLDAAYREFSKAIAINGENPTAFVNRGIVLREMKRYEEAQKDFLTAQSFDPQNALIEFEMGLTALAQNDSGTAFAHMDRAVALQPDDMGAQMYRASLLYRLGRFDDAIDGYTHVLEKADDALKLRAYIERGLAKEQKQDFASAVDDYTAALTRDKENVPALNRRGVCLERLGKHEEAIADFTHLLESVPAEQASLIYFNRAGSYRALGRLDEAVVDYTHALEHTSDVLPIYIERSISYRLMDRNEEALLDIERALAIDPKNADLLNLRAIEKIQLNDVHGALADLDAAIGLEPKNAAFFANRAGVLENMGEKAKAIDDYTAALRLEPGNAKFYYRRGYLYRLSGKMAESESDYKAATAIEPDLPAYK
ncbi:tetratricopeptide repeat protein [Selenomonas sputigena]|uniref:tetratricopeptide repeat protein n=1 Tax=Selenomonas sputigena TaxID=69823 RepID=UPI002232BA98|nr:tetratricopeptide repeat protein [Selenomonas sputigena]UZD43773.1 tetratricopeptide repeat protein [Selenomonas sputigena]